MNKEKLGIELSRMRNGKPIGGLTKYAIKSIEEGRSSYPVSNLLIYCEAISQQLVLTDMATDESYPVDNMQEIHEVLQMQMERWQIDDSLMYRKTGIHYTAKKGATGSLSIVTMLAMCEVLHCKLDFIPIN
jgi:hypothetical protein